MSDLRTAALRALEALEHAGKTGDWILAGPAITALREALVEDAMQKFTDVNQELEAALAAPIIQPEMLVAHNNNDMDKYISAITLNGEVWRLTQTNNELRLEAKDCFIEGMTDQTKIIGGLTIGKARRAELHSLLEQWLETVINYKLNEKNA